MALGHIRTEPIALVIDDDPFIRRLVRGALEPAGIQIEEAGDGAAGLAALQEVWPDIVLLDVRMPSMDGFAVCRAMRQLSGASQIPVLMLTALDDVASIHDAYESGAADFIGKPINWTVLPYRVRSLLAASKLQRQRKQTEDELRESKERLREVIAHQDRVKEDERTRIAREIHDELGGLLTGIRSYFSFAMYASTRLGLAPEGNLVDAARLADQAIGTVRRVISDLRPSVLDHLGIWTALEWHAGQVEQQTGLKCSVRIDAAAASRELDAERSTALFRIVQESLTNAVRHASASSILIDAQCRDGSLFVSLHDDGKGIDPLNRIGHQSWGIEGMHERARYLGGEMWISGAPGQGTTVLVRLPLESSDGG